MFAVVEPSTPLTTTSVYCGISMIFEFIFSFVSSVGSILKPKVSVPSQFLPSNTLLPSMTAVPVA